MFQVTYREKSRPQEAALVSPAASNAPVYLLGCILPTYRDFRSLQRAGRCWVQRWCGMARSTRSIIVCSKIWTQVDVGRKGDAWLAVSLALIVMVQLLSLDELTVGACGLGRGDSTGGFEIMGWQWRAVPAQVQGH